MNDAPGPAVRRPLRGIVVGLGQMGTHHLRVLASLPSVEVVAMADPDQARRDALLRAYSWVRGYDSLEQALDAHDDLDFVCLAVPVAELPGRAVLAFSAGLHVFAEKPMAPDEDAARLMVSAAADRDRVLCVGYVERFNPAVIALKKKLDDGAVGRVIEMHARRLSPFPNRDRMAGVTLDLATHDIDIMRHLSGSEVERVYAESSGATDERWDDLACAVIRFESGTTGLLEVNWVTPTKVRELSVLGEGGMFVVNYLTQDLTFFEHPVKSTEWERLAGIHGGGEGNMVRYALERREPLRVQWEAFVDAVTHGKPAPVNGLDGLATLSTAHAIHLAATEHRVVAARHREADHV